jgi:hypothetical protein
MHWAFIGVLENKHLENWKTKRENKTKGMFEEVIVGTPA